MTTLNGFRSRNDFQKKKKNEWYDDCWLTIVDVTNSTAQPVVTGGYYCGATGLWRDTSGTPIEAYGVHVIAWAMCYIPAPYIPEEGE